jgi:hypothetical protein
MKNLRISRILNVFRENMEPDKRNILGKTLQLINRFLR